jgi:hypothetical protein
MLVLGIVFAWFVRGGASFRIRQRMRYRPRNTSTPGLDDYMTEKMYKGLEEDMEVEKRLREREQREDMRLRRELQELEDIDKA